MPVPASFFRTQRANAKECMTCQRTRLNHRMNELQTRRETHLDPAEYAWQCEDCRDAAEDWR